MDERESLRRSVCASPSDEGARQVFADYLMSQGDPRGRFIAEQTRLATLDALHAEYPALLASTRRLQHRHAPEWLAFAADCLDFAEESARVQVGALRDARFERGFLRTIAMRPAEIAEAWPRIAAREPAVGADLLIYSGLHDDEFDLEPPKAWEVLRVRPEEWFTASSLAGVLGWGPLAVRELDLSGCDIGPDGVALLVGDRHDLARHYDDWKEPPPVTKGQLVELGLRGTGLHDAGVRGLFVNDTLTGLRRLDVSQCRLEAAASLEAIRGAAQLEFLDEFSIAGNNGLGGQLEGLAGWGRVPALEVLGLPQSTTPRDLDALFPSASPNLRELDLRAAKGLLSEPETVSGCAERFTKLRLGTTRVGDKGLAAILAAPSSTTLLELELGGCSLSDKSIDALTRSPLDRLVSLDLGSNKLTDKGLTQLARWPGLKHITHLKLGNNRKLGAEGHAAMMESPHFDPVRYDAGKCKDQALIGVLRERFGSALEVRD